MTFRREAPIRMEATQATEATAALVVVRAGLAIVPGKLAVPMAAVKGGGLPAKLADVPSCHTSAPTHMR